MKETIENLKESIESKECCLMLGAGSTISFVGSWNKLLSTMLGRRFASRWLNNCGLYKDIESIINKNCASKFFTDAEYLELGEYLLSDKTIPTPREFNGKDVDWQEKLLCHTVAEVICENESAELEGHCDAYKECKAKASCVFNPEYKTERNYNDIYESWQRNLYIYKDVVKDLKHKHKECKIYSGIDTTMAVIELCAKRSIKYVINYNFDLIIERALYEVLVANKNLEEFSDIKEIHIWTFGSPIDNIFHCQTICEDDNYKMFLHKGQSINDIAALDRKDSIHFFHVHGIASHLIDRKFYEGIIFSQHSYNTYQMKNLNWSNQVLETIASRYSILGIGFSGTDPNFRRFAAIHKDVTGTNPIGYLENCCSSNKTNIVLLRAQEGYAKAINDTLKKKTRVANAYLEYCIEIITDYYKTYFNIDILWYSNFNDIASFIEKLSKE